MDQAITASAPRAPGRDLHHQITAQIIAAMEGAPGEFILPWRQDGAMRLPTNAFTDNPYSGINILSLWVAAQRQHFVSPLWATYRQWASLGAQVRQGEKATLIVFYKQYDVTPDPEDAADTGRRRVARASFVFNAAQVDGYAAAPAPTPLEPVGRIATVEHFIAATKATITYGGDRAFYIPSRDYIQLPDDHRFVGTATMHRQEALYATLLHELVHWSGAKHRLDRDLSGRFGTASYAAEELVAELGAAFLCSELGISNTVRPDHAQYLSHWLKLLKNDDRAIFTAAARASEAARFLHTLSASPEGNHQPTPLIEHANA